MIYVYGYFIGFFTDYQDGCVELSISDDAPELLVEDCSITTDTLARICIDYML